MFSRNVVASSWFKLGSLAYLITPLNRSEALSWGHKTLHQMSPICKHSVTNFTLNIPSTCGTFTIDIAHFYEVSAFWCHVLSFSGLGGCTRLAKNSKISKYYELITERWSQTIFIKRLLLCALTYDRLFTLPEHVTGGPDSDWEAVSNFNHSYLHIFKIVLKNSCFCFFDLLKLKVK